MTLQEEIAVVINKHSAENGSDTPDFILAKFLIGCLNVFNATTKERDKWYGVDHSFDPEKVKGG